MTIGAAACSGGMTVDLDIGFRAPRNPAAQPYRDRKSKLIASAGLHADLEFHRFAARAM